MILSGEGAANARRGQSDPGKAGKTAPGSWEEKNLDPEKQMEEAPREMTDTQVGGRSFVLLAEQPVPKKEAREKAVVRKEDVLTKEVDRSRVEGQGRECCCPAQK